MALSASEISKIKRYLGYPQVVADPWHPAGRSIDFACAALDAEGELRAQEMLTDLAGLDTSISQARGRLKAEQVGDLRLNARKELSALLGERIRVSGELADTLGVPFKGDEGGGITV